MPAPLMDPPVYHMSRHGYFPEVLVEPSPAVYHTGQPTDANTLNLKIHPKTFLKNRHRITEVPERLFSRHTAIHQSPRHPQSTEAQSADGGSRSRSRGRSRTPRRWTWSTRMTRRPTCTASTQWSTVLSRMWIITTMPRLLSRRRPDQDSPDWSAHGGVREHL